MTDSKAKTGRFLNEDCIPEPVRMRRKTDESGCVGSRGLKVEHLENYLPEGVTEIVSGGARGVDTCARENALSHGLKLTEFLPEYDKYGRSAPLKRNITIIENADLVLAFWDGVSHGT